ncbi:Membrane proteins related to metalloendopeptidases [Alteromonadaceae bacterium Bs31]|nr:Membrane proteins related to metalloendopeptidases [Alteromonadaceae bacterium Bs31]
MESILYSVGKGGKNTYKDVCTIQTLLNNNIHNLAPMELLSVDGDCGKKTVTLISEFQRRVLNSANPDGRVDPNGTTLRLLNVNAVEPAAHTADANNKPAEELSEELCFPLQSRPEESYKEGMRRFASNRRGGRKHAGVDLYAPVGTPIYAMSDGEIINGPYAFYLGTQALEIKHKDFVARYGEISGVAPGLQKGETVKAGQLIAYVGELRGLNMSMLHLELYDGSGAGPLTVRANKPFKRRNDLLDPTAFLDKAECQ